MQKTTLCHLLLIILGYENDSCQISLIFLHKPWHIGFYSFPIWGKGSRKGFSAKQIEWRAMSAVSFTWHETVFKGLLEGNVSSTGSKSITTSRLVYGETLPAFVMSIYGYWQAHWDPQVSIAVAKAMLLALTDIFPLLRDEMKGEFISKRDRTAAESAMRRITDIKRDRALNYEVRNYYTTKKDMSDEEFSVWAFYKIIDIEGVNRTKRTVEKIIYGIRQLLEEEVVDLIEDVNDLYWLDEKEAKEEESQRQYEDMKNNGRSTEEELDDLLDDLSSDSDDD